MPARRARLRLRVAGRTLVLRSERPLPALDPPPGYAPFLGGRGDDIVLDVVRGPAPALRADRHLFASGGTWDVYGDGRGGLLYSFRTRGPRVAPERILHVDRAVRRGTLSITDAASAGSPGYALAYPLDDLLFQHHLAHRGEIVLHGAGLVVDGRAVVLAGTSGAGKTTSVRLWRRYHRAARVLSDDRVVLRRRGGRWWVYGTPWHGEGRFQSPEGAPLHALVLLRQSAESAVTRVGAAAACLRLCGLTFPPRWDRRAVERVLAAVADVAGAVPVWELRFRPDRSAVAAVRQEVTGAVRRRAAGPSSGRGPRSGSAATRPRGGARPRRPGSPDR